MVTADRSAPLRRVGSLLGLLGLEAAAVAALHWLGRLPALRIPWERPLPWLLDSPVQDVLGSLLRMVGLVMAYWLLASSVLYLLASLSHLPAAVRAVRWLTLPLVRRVADHAVAVTLATSMVGGGTLATAGTAGAAPGRGVGVGPPARRPVAAAPAPATTPRPWAAAQPTSTTGGQDEPAQPRYRPRPAGQEPTTTGQDEPAQPRYRPQPAGQAPPLSEPATSPTEPETTPPSTEPPTSEPTTTQPTTSETTTTTTTPPRSAAAPSTTAATTGPSASPQPEPPTTAAPATTTTTRAAGGGTTESTAGRQGRAAGQPSTTTALRPPAYRFNPAGTTTTTTTTTTTPEAGQGSGQPGSGSKSGTGGGESGGQGQGGAHQATSYRVVRGDNLWTIARTHLAEVRGRRAADLSDREIAAYWVTVVEANRGGLRSGDPDLIYPGEVVELPPVSGS